jgi:hypothetical protein
MVLTPLIVLAVFSIGPGFVIVERLRWRPLETLGASIGLSWIIVYLAAFVIYAWGLPGSLYLALFCLAVIATLACSRGLWRLFRRVQVYRTLAAWLCLLAWGLSGLALIRNYSGGNWASDWFEHFERTQFFAERWPLDRGMSGYWLPARPPLMNLAAACVLSITGLDFQGFQVVFLFLNSLVFIPLCLIGPALGGRRPSIAVLAILLMANPMFQQNVTWTWTKLFTAFYVILGCGLYLAGKRRGDSGRIIAAFVALAAGCLVHYSAAPFAIYVVGYEAMCLLGVSGAVSSRRSPLTLPSPAAAGGEGSKARKPMWRASLIGWLAALALLATWFGWSWKHYGDKTFSSTTTVEAWGRGSASQEVTKFAVNGYRSFVPHPVWLSMTDVKERFQQSSSLGFWRDYVFEIYQPNFIFGVGALSGAVAVGLLLYTFGKRSGPWRKQSLFWPGFLLVTIPLGIFVHPARDTYGVAHICGQPVVLLGVALVATYFTALPPWVRGLIVLGTAVDLVAGVLIQWLAEGGSTGMVSRFSEFARRNEDIAVTHHVRFLGDSVSELTAAVAIVGVALVGLLALWWLARMALGRQQRQ